MRFVAVVILTLGLAHSSFAADSAKSNEQNAPNSRQRAYAIWQFHSLIWPMQQYHYRLERLETERKAKSGDKTAYMPMFFMTYLSPSYIPGNRDNQLDVCEAAHWLDLAVKDGAAPAAYWMSQLYLAGNAVPKDPEKAYRFFLFWAATLDIKPDELPVPPAAFQISDEVAARLQQKMMAWDARTEPAIPMRSCKGCADTNNHVCKLATLRQMGLDPEKP